MLDSGAGLLRRADLRGIGDAPGRVAAAARRQLFCPENGNPAIDPDVLREFRELTEDEVVWDRWAYMWRHREPGDGPGRKQDRVAQQVATLHEFPMSPEQGLGRAQASAAFKKHGLNPRAFGSWVNGGYLAREGDRRWLTNKGQEWADSHAEETESLG